MAAGCIIVFFLLLITVNVTHLVLVTKAGPLQFAGLVRRERFGRSGAEVEVIVELDHVADGVENFQAVEPLVAVVIVQPTRQHIINCRLN